MFGGLDLGGEETRALLKCYVLAHHLEIVGGLFEDAISNYARRDRAWRARLVRHSGTVGDVRACYRVSLYGPIQGRRTAARVAHEAAAQEWCR